MSADSEILETSSRELYKVVAFGDFKVKLAVFDQMLYFIKELMVESPQDFLITQYMQQFIKMVKVWYLCERNKLKLNERSLKAKLCDGMEILQTNVFREPSPGDEAQRVENSKVGTRMVNHQYLFDAMDMVALLGCNSKDALVRQLSIILMAESGKLKRLLIPKEVYKHSLYDVFYYSSDEIKEQLVKRMLIVNPYKQGELKSLDDMKKAVGDLSPYQLIVDKFEYRKSGVTESFIRDLQVMWIGEVTSRWKLKITEGAEDQESSQIVAGPVVLDFINIMSHRTLAAFDGKTESAPQKDFVGLNILMALVLYQITRSNFQGISATASPGRPQEGV